MCLFYSNDHEPTKCYLLPHSAIIEKLKSFESFAAPHTKLLLGKFKKLGLFSSEPAEARENLLDTLCARLENLMQYETGEQDLVYLQHTFIVERKDGKIETITSVLDERGSPTGWSAMARLVGIPCGIAVDLVLNGTIKTPGVLAPYDIDVSSVIVQVLYESGLTNSLCFASISCATPSKRSLPRSTSRWLRKSSREQWTSMLDTFHMAQHDPPLLCTSHHTTKKKAK